MASNINNHTVHFDKGSNGTIIKSTVTGDGVNDYTLEAKAGQMMHINMNSQRRVLISMLSLLIIIRFLTVL
jgi:hypothetical protein